MAGSNRTAKLLFRKQQQVYTGFRQRRCTRPTGCGVSSPQNQQRQVCRGRSALTFKNNCAALWDTIDCMHAAAATDVACCNQRAHTSEQTHLSPHKTGTDQSTNNAAHTSQKQEPQTLSQERHHVISNISSVSYPASAGTTPHHIRLHKHSTSDSAIANSQGQLCAQANPKACWWGNANQHALPAPQPTLM